MSSVPQGSLVSIIVPTKNSARLVGACLKSIKGQSYGQIEIIVVDNGSSDQTKQIARKYTDKVYTFGPERSAQRNYGAQNAEGDFLLFVDADMQLTPEVVAASVDKVTRDRNVKAVVIPEESFGEGFWAQCKRLERSFYVGVDWMEAARFFVREVFEEMGGYDAANTGTEDYDLPQRIELAYGARVIGRVTDHIYHDEQRINLMRTCRKKFYYAKRLTRYKSIDANRERFRQQAFLPARYKLFFSHPAKLFRNPVVGLGMLFMKACEFGFGVLGYIWSKIERPFQST